MNSSAGVVTVVTRLLYGRLRNPKLIPGKGENLSVQSVYIDCEDRSVTEGVFCQEMEPGVKLTFYLSRLPGLKCVGLYLHYTSAGIVWYLVENREKYP